jgi:hypothetical protein
VVIDAAVLAPGARITARVARGVVLATVNTVTPGAGITAAAPRSRTRR